MTAPELELTSALAEWRRLAEAEGNAIRAGNWGLVADCQKALSQLRPVIDQHTALRNGGNSETVKHRSAKATVLELIELQRRNLLSLEQRRQRLSEHMENLARAGKNLRALKRSYSVPIAAAWSSYS
jgi:hypothetical protein